MDHLLCQAGFSFSLENGDDRILRHHDKYERKYEYLTVCEVVRDRQEKQMKDVLVRTG